MLLQHTHNGEPFATGAIAYRIPQQGTDAARITIALEIEEHLTEAIIDTAAPYVVCSPSLAKLLNLNPANAISTDRMLIRGYWLRGGLHRVNLSLLPDIGEALSIEAPAFVPDPNQEFTEGFLPRSFLGLTQCLESICFAIDPHREFFYFG
jgi:hypothetical protein